MGLPPLAATECAVRTGDDVCRRLVFHRDHGDAGRQAFFSTRQQYGRTPRGRIRFASDRNASL